MTTSEIHGIGTAQDEERRLATLQRLQILDTPADERFDRIARLAQRLCGFHYAFIALVDRDRIWYKSSVGYAFKEVARKDSLFRGELLSVPLICPDARMDPAFASNVEVVRAPYVRCFVAFPVFAVDGSCLGALCAGHRSPRILGESDQAMMRDLARMVEEQIDSAGLIENFVHVLEAAEQQVLLRDRLVDMISHELRTPLNGILGFAQFLAGGAAGPLNPEQQSCLKDVLDSANHLRALVEDALDLTKAETGRLQYHPERVRAGALIDQVVAALSAQASEKRIPVEVEASPELPEMMLDPARFRQVVHNYLSNALKYTPAGGSVAVRVLLETPDTCRLEVQDTGIGIRQQDLDCVFTAFAQVRQRATLQLGTGLGLVLTKRIVEAQGGRVGVRSEVGRGSTFWAVFPLRSERPHAG